VTEESNMDTQLNDVMTELHAIKETLEFLVKRQAILDYYDTDQFAALVGKSVVTVTGWCRDGRIHAKKKLSGRGGSLSWVISHEEYLRYQREGLLAHPCRQ
jgi:hypothetical protein